MNTPIYDAKGNITGYKVKSYPSGKTNVVISQRDREAANQRDREEAYRKINLARKSR